MSKVNPENRCQHTSPKGRPCRSLRAPDHSSLCPYHVKEQKRKENDSASIALDLLGPVKEFYTALSANYIIGRLLVLQACDRIPPRKAAVLAYTCQLLLQSQHDVKTEISAVSPELSALVKQVYDPHSALNTSEETKGDAPNPGTNGSMPSEVSSAVPPSPSSAAAASPSPGTPAFCDSIYRS